MENRHIYLDNSATTKISDKALQTYIDVSKEDFGNPSSLHAMGVNAEKHLDYTRKILLKSIGGEKDYTCFFTSCGSEANNLAITGRAFSKERYRKGCKIISTEGEHASVSEPLHALEKEGFEVVFIPTKNGKLNFEMLEAELTSNVILVTAMMVNNETGAVYDIPKLSKMMKSKCKEAVLHVDATQSFMKIPFLMKVIGADMLTVSSHKIEGPKGIGSLVVSNDLIKKKGISPIILGGGQENGYRSGTENVPGIASFGTAIEENLKNLLANIEKMENLRSYLIKKLENDEKLSSISITNPEFHAPHILNITVNGIKSETMLHYLSSKNIYVSSGSACSSNSSHLSSALLAYGRSAKEADSSIRISFSHTNEISDVDALVEELENGVAKLTGLQSKKVL